jgi:glutamyl-tRNA synthetase
MAGQELRQMLYRCALQNAVKHGGVPQTGAVIGMVMGAHPELRSRAKEVSVLAKEVVARVADRHPAVADRGKARVSLLLHLLPVYRGTD